MKDNFEQSEEISKETFKNFCEKQKWCKIKRFTENKYAPYDVVYENQNQKTIGEIKRRKNLVTDYSQWFLEKEKYDKLMEIYNNTDSKPLVTYINHFRDNVTAVWDLLNIDVTKLELTKEYMQENDFSDKKVLKWVFKLPLQMAKRYITDENLPLFALQY
jgi:hypothetical protein